MPIVAIHLQPRIGDHKTYLAPVNALPLQAPNVDRATDKGMMNEAEPSTVLPQV
jgi:hypothetical protein